MVVKYIPSGTGYPRGTGTQYHWTPSATGYPVPLDTQCHWVPGATGHPVPLGTRCHWTPSAPGTQSPVNNWHWCIPRWKQLVSLFIWVNTFPFWYRFTTRRHGWLVTLFDTYSQGTVFKPQYHHPWNDPGEVTDGSVVSNDSFVPYWIHH